MRGDNRKRYRDAARNALIATVAFALLDVFLRSQAGDWPSVAINALMAVLITFPGTFAISLLVESYGRRRRERQGSGTSSAPPRPASAVTPFRHAARQWKAAASFWVFLAVMAGLMWLLSTDPNAPTGGILLFLEWSLIALMVFAVPMSLMSLHLVTTEIDSFGVRSTRWPRGINVAWTEVGRILVAYPPAPPLAPGGFPMPEMYALVGKDGSFLGMVTPRLEVGKEFVEPMRAALREYAARSGVPVVDVSWRDIRKSWRAGLKRRRAAPPR